MSIIVNGDKSPCLDIANTVKLCENSDILVFQQRVCAMVQDGRILLSLPLRKHGLTFEWSEVQDHLAHY